MMCVFFHNNDKMLQRLFLYRTKSTNNDKILENAHGLIANFSGNPPYRF